MSDKFNAFNQAKEEVKKEEKLKRSCQLKLKWLNNKRR